MTKRITITRNGSHLRKEIQKAASLVSKNKVGFKSEDVIQQLKNSHVFTEDDRDVLVETGLRVLVGRVSCPKPLSNSVQGDLFPDFKQNGFTRIMTKNPNGKLESLTYSNKQLTPKLIKSHTKRVPKKPKLPKHEGLSEFADKMMAEGYSENTTIAEYFDDKVIIEA